MNVSDLIRGIRKSIVEDNLTAYKEIFEKNGQTSDPYWRDALALYNSLDAVQKSVLYRVIRQVEVDTVSTLLGVLDGTTYLDHQATGLTLLADDNIEPLNGELQDRFLEMEENSY